MKLSIFIMGVLVLANSVAHAGDSVAGNWKTESGETTQIVRCGADYCVIAKSGQYAGMKLGTFKGEGDDFAGRLTDPKTKATYSGKIAVSKDKLMLRGCATAVLCRSQTWSRQN